MKPKMSPTSPKAKKENEQDKELNNYYMESLKNIEKPNKKRTPIWFLFVVIIFGFLGGILGQLVLLSYGSEIPFFDQLDIFSLTERQPFFINSNNNDNKLTLDEADQIVEDERYSIVQIFDLIGSSDNLTSLYIPDNQLGLGIAITNDGYFLTTDDVVIDNESEYVVITENKEVYLINSIIEDPSTNFKIITTDATNLKAINMASYDDIAKLEDIFIINKYGFGTNPQIQLSSIKEKNYRSVSELSDYFQSSEQLVSLLLIDSVDGMDNALAFTYDNQAIGFVTIVNDRSVIYPFYFIKDKIASVLENQEVIRPYLGINYINLSNIANISNDLSNEQTKGALIYNGDEIAEAGIIKNSPAEKAGLQENDIILSINNQIINGYTSLSQLVQTYNAGDVVTLKVFRQGEELDIKITLESII
ncbi:MAG: PDZ domain-containing protein [bacterium]|nr:PDZ domain-containing protein [bacterium]